MQSLGNFSFYSFFGSLLSPRELAELAYHLGYRVVGLSDRGGFWGLVEFSQACARVGVKPVFGSRLEVVGHGELQLTLLNEDGYRALSYFLSHYTEPGKPVDPGVLQAFWREFGGHFHASVRPVPERHTASPQVSDWLPWQARWDRWMELLGPELWVELHWVNGREQALQRRAYREWSKLTDRWVIMSGARCVEREQWETLKVLQSIGTLTRLKQDHPDKLVVGDYSLVAAEVLRHRFMKSLAILASTERFVKACQFDFEFGLLWLPHVQRVQCLQEAKPMSRHGETDTALWGMAAEDGGAYGVQERAEDEARQDRDFRELRYLCLRGMVKLYVREPYPWRNKPGRKQLMELIRGELAIIRETGYAGYFLIFYDVVRACEERRIPLLARGSAAGSLVCYCLGVSNVCPFRFELNFERFLNRERLRHSKLPDIDLDLPWDRRDEVIDYIYRKYGEDHVAMIGGFSTFKARAAIADVAKTMGLAENEARHLTRYISHSGMERFLHKRELSVENQHLAYEDQFEDILRQAVRLDGLPRHPMMHPCGIVIADRPLTDFTPLIPSNKGFRMTQYSMQPIEDLGLLKLDLLGQAGLSVIRDACQNIREVYGVAEPLQGIDYEDTEIYRMMATGEARGVFHIESPAMTGLLKLCRCADIDCLVGVVSVIRPGAANEDKKTLFARRYLGLEPPQYAHPDLEPWLKDTYGLMVYEEHILLVAHHWAGVDLGRADLLRRMLVKKLKGRDLKEMEDEFRECARELGRDEEAIDTVWKLLADFSGYMFNKAHGAAYAVEAFQGAYLKRHYPCEFLTGVLQSGRGFYSALVYVLELLRYGARFALPDVRDARDEFWYESGVVHYPLSRIKGLGRRFVERWRVALEQGPFRHFEDFLVRVFPEPADLGLLARVGALRGFFENRFEAVWEADRYKPKEFADRMNRLFEPMEPEEPFPFVKPDPEAFARWEAEILGYPVSCNPFELWLKGLDRTTTVRVEDLGDYVGREVDICGLVVAVRGLHTVKGQPMKFISVADETGIAELTLFPRAYQQIGFQVSRSRSLRIRVLVEWDRTESAVCLQGLSVEGSVVREAVRKDRAKGKVAAMG